MYAVHYDSSTGEILSIVDAAYASSGDWEVSALPEDMAGNYSDFYVSEGTPNVFIQRSTGYAYAEDGTRAYSGDVDPEIIEIIDDDDLEERGIESSPSIGGNNAYSDGGAITGDTTETAEITTGLAAGGILCRLVLGAEYWALNEDGKYIYGIADTAITRSMFLNCLGINRGAVKTPIYWKSANGLITFTTVQRPDSDITMTAVLQETGDEWAAAGIIDAWPGSSFVHALFRQSFHQATITRSDSTNTICNAYDFTLALAAGESVTIQTTVDFAAAELLFCTPRWTGHSHVIMPHFYVDSATNMFRYTLTNLGSNAVQISEVAIDILYSGSLTGFTGETSEDVALSNYITDQDIDELDE